MKVSLVGAIVRKDTKEFVRNRFFVFLTLLVLVAWVAVFWFLPDDVDETVRIGVAPSEIGALLPTDGETTAAGMSVALFDTEDDLRTAVGEGSDGIAAGIAFPDGFVSSIAGGEAPTVRVLVPAGLPAEIRTLLEGSVNEIAFAISGSPPPVNLTTESVILGTDRAGAQISLQQQMRPLLLIMVLMVETFALASLVSIEVQQRTVVAILATPVRVTEFLAAKGIFGVGLAFSEVAILALLIGAFDVNPAVIVLVLLLGAVLVTGFGMIAGAYGRDFIGTLLVAMLFMIPLMIPAFAALFPGSVAAWVKAIPTYGLVESMIRVTVDGSGLVEILPVVLLLAGWGLAAFAAGAMVLRRRVATL
ncbi:MAG: ABC transporter permease [Actinomycetota bacterium]